MIVVVNMTLAIPDEMHLRMKKHSEIKWTEIARVAFASKLKELEAEKKEWQKAGLRHALENWDEANELINY